MLRKLLLFRNLVESIPKNSGIYLIGALFLVFYGYPTDPLKILLGLVALLVSYSSVYIFNDIWDAEEDSRDAARIKRKPIAMGYIKPVEAAPIGILFLVAGSVLSYLAGAMFLEIVIAILVANFIYSAPGLRLKRSFLGRPLVAAIQFFKMLLPWTINLNVAGFPYLLAAGFSIIYLIFFRSYKKIGHKDSGTVGASFRENKALSLFTIAVFAAALLVHPSPMPQAVLLGFVLGGIAVFWRTRFLSNRFVALGTVYILISLAAIVYIINALKIFGY